MAQTCITFCADNELGLATDPLRWLDLALSDLFLLGHVKHRLKGTAFATHEELRAAIGEIMTDIPKETSQCVSDRWMERHESVFQHNGGYCS
jgi:hypothetical protein